jgi:parallel beta-helix repeat protein
MAPRRSPLAHPEVVDGHPDFISLLRSMHPAPSDVPDDPNVLFLDLPRYDLSQCENPTVNKPITLRSSIGTTIVCPAISIDCPGVVLDGLDFHGSVHLNSAHRTTIVNCTFHHADAIADLLAFLSVTDSRDVTLRDVTITGNSSCPGLYLRQNARVTAVRVIVRDLSESLVVVNNGAHLNATDSTFSDSSANLVYSSGGARLEMRRCTLSRGAFPGIFMHDGFALLRENKFEQMKQNGISLNKVRDFVVEANQLDDVHSSAIAIGEGSKGIIKGNRLRKIDGNGIYVSGYSTVEVEGNTVEEDKYPGIALLQGTSGVLRQNIIRSVECSGVCLRNARSVEIYGLTVVGANECGISISDTTSCKISGSTFETCGIAGIECYNLSRIEILGCTVKQCPIAFQVYTGAKVQATGNTAIDISRYLTRVLFRGRARVIGTTCTRVQALADAQTPRTCLFTGNGSFENWTNSEKLADLLGITVRPTGQASGPRLCLKCNLRPRTVFLMDCGHRAYCEQCARMAKEANELCPVCRFPIANTTLGYDVNAHELCLICLENPPSCIAIPCGHCGFCKTCMEAWYKDNKTCPACRYDSSSFKQIVWDL